MNSLVEKKNKANIVLKSIADVEKRLIGRIMNAVASKARNAFWYYQILHIANERFLYNKLTLLVWKNS